MPLSANARIGLIVGALGLSLAIEGAVLAYLGQSNAQKHRVEFADIPVSPLDTKPYVVPSNPNVVTSTDSSGTGTAPGNPGSPSNSLSPVRPVGPAGTGAPQPGPAAEPPKTQEGKKNFEAAAAAMKKGDVKAAQAGLAKVLKVEPTNQAALLNLAMLHMSQNKPKEAAVQLEALVKQAPKDAAVRFELAKAYVASRNLPKAESQLREVVRLQPKENAGRVLLAQLLVELKKPGQAYSLWEDAAKRNPKDVESRMQLAAIANDVQKKPALAEKWLKEAVAIGANDPRPPILLSQLMMARKQPKAAVKVLADAVKRQPKMLELYPTLAEARAASGDLKGAIAAMNTAISLTPKPSTLPAGPARLAATRTTASLHLALGRLLGNARKTTEARAQFQKVIQLAPKSVEGYGFLARTQMEQKDFSGAVQSLKKAVAVEPKSPTEQRLLARASGEIKDWKTADAAFTAYTKMVPDDAAAYAEWAQMWVAAKQPAKGVAIWDRVIKLAPKSDIAHAQRGLLLRTIGRDEAALADFRKVQQLNPKSADALYEVATMETKLGNSAAAAKTWARLMELEPNIPEGYVGLLEASQKAGTAETARIKVARGLARDSERKEKVRVLSEVLKYYNRVKKPAEAKLLLTQVIEENPNAKTAKAALDSFTPAAAPEKPAATPEKPAAADAD